MMMTPNALFTAVMFLALGLVLFTLFMTAVYPVLAERHEQAKVTQSQGRSPRVVANLVRATSLIILPLVGFVLGGKHFISLPGLN
jgi:hypothetical protein